MTALDPDPSAIGACRNVRANATWKPEPRLRGKGFASVGKSTLQDQQLDPIIRGERNLYPWRPAFDDNILTTIGKERQHLDAIMISGGHKPHLIGIDPAVRPVRKLKLPELHKYRATWCGPRRV